MHEQCEGTDISSISLDAPDRSYFYSELITIVT